MKMADFKCWFDDRFKYTSLYYDLKEYAHGHFSDKLKEIIEEIYCAGYDSGYEDGYEDGREDNSDGFND